jgi:hypothetical protein
MKRVIEILEEALETMLQVTKIPEHYQEVVYIKEALAELKALPRWETPEQYRKRMGEAWPENAAVYYRYNFDYKTYHGWMVGCHKDIVNLRADIEALNAGTHQIICATEAGPPSDSWRPEEEKKQEKRRCRVCGCTDDDCRQCIEKTGEPCYWVEEDLCSACAGKEDDILIEWKKESEA